MSSNQLSHPPPKYRSSSTMSNRGHDYRQCGRMRLARVRVRWRTTNVTKERKICRRVPRDGRRGAKYRKRIWKVVNPDGMFNFSTFVVYGARATREYKHSERKRERKKKKKKKKEQKNTRKREKEGQEGTFAVIKTDRSRVGIPVVARCREKGNIKIKFKDTAQIKRMIRASRDVTIAIANSPARIAVNAISVRLMFPREPLCLDCQSSRSA